MALWRCVPRLSRIPTRLAEVHAEVTHRRSLVGGNIDTDALEVIRENRALSCGYCRGPLRSANLSAACVVSLAIVPVYVKRQARCMENSD
jgi:hypothetical protein